MTTFSLVESLLGEAKTETEAETAEPVDSVTDDSNKDIEADKDDVQSDGAEPEETEDTSDDSPDSDSSSDETDSTASTDGNDTSTDIGFDQEQESKNKEKKLLLYKSLRTIRATFANLADVTDTLVRADLPQSSVETLKVVRGKVNTNVEMLDDLLSNTEIATSKTYADLQVIHNIYKGDLVVIDNNLKVFSRLLKGKP